MATSSPYQHDGCHVLRRRRSTQDSDCRLAAGAAKSLFHLLSPPFQQFTVSQETSTTATDLDSQLFTLSVIPTFLHRRLPISWIFWVFNLDVILFETDINLIAYGILHHSLSRDLIIGHIHDVVNSHVLAPTVPIYTVHLRIYLKGHPQGTRSSVTPTNQYIDGCHCSNRVLGGCGVGSAGGNIFRTLREFKC